MWPMILMMSSAGRYAVKSSRLHKVSRTRPFPFSAVLKERERAHTGPLPAAVLAFGVCVAEADPVAERVIVAIAIAVAASGTAFARPPPTRRTRRGPSPYRRHPRRQLPTTRFGRDRGGGRGGVGRRGQ